ncbi:hypothetical protein BC826DRAFT_1021453 [Russula brevipes]|nr:hypothetical protein BC826DRAFT_1021453 [Russula brevipes]
MYRPLVPDKEFIAKKVREQSDELKSQQHEIEVRPCYPVDRVWAILPKMLTVKGCAENWPERFESKVVQVRLGLIKGVAYLHGCRVAHRDIKPNNLVVDRGFCLKITDFDVATRVRDEDEEVDDLCGTEHLDRARGREGVEVQSDESQPMGLRAGSSVPSRFSIGSGKETSCFNLLGRWKRMECRLEECIETST